MLSWSVAKWSLLFILVICRSQPADEYGLYSDEEEVDEEEEEELQHGHSYFHVNSMGEANLVADGVRGGEALSFSHAVRNPYKIIQEVAPEELGNCTEAPAQETEESLSSEQFSAPDSLGREREESNEESLKGEVLERDSDFVRNYISSTRDAVPSPVMLDQFQNDSANGILVFDCINILSLSYINN